MDNLEQYQMEAGLWGKWLVYRIAGLVMRCGAVKEFHRHYVERRFMWWFKYAYKKKRFLAKFAGRQGLIMFEKIAMQKLVVRLWRRGWQETVAVFKMVEPVRKKYGNLSMLIEQWRGGAAYELGLAYELFSKVLDYVILCRLQQWKGNMKTKAFLMGCSIVGNSVTARMLDLVENQGYPLGRAAFSLEEVGVADKKTLEEIVEQMRNHRKGRQKSK